MFQSTESRPALAVLAVPALALLLAGGASVQSRSHRRPGPVAEPTVQVGTACVADLTFTPEGWTTQAGAAPTALEISPAGVMDLSFGPTEQVATATPAPSTATAANLEITPAAGMDVSFTTSER